MRALHAEFNPLFTAVIREENPQVFAHVNYEDGIFYNGETWYRYNGLKDNFTTSFGERVSVEDAGPIGEAIKELYVMDGRFRHLSNEFHERKCQMERQAALDTGELFFPGKEFQVDDRGVSFEGPNGEVFRVAVMTTGFHFTVYGSRMRIGVGVEGGFGVPVQMEDGRENFEMIYDTLFANRQVWKSAQETFMELIE